MNEEVEVEVEEEPYVFPIDWTNLNPKSITSPLFWSRKGITKAWRDQGYRFYDESNWRDVFSEHYDHAPDYIRRDARRKMSFRRPASVEEINSGLADEDGKVFVGGMLQLRAIPRITGYVETRPLFPQIRPNTALEKPAEWSWHCSCGECVAPVYQPVPGDEDRLYVALAWGRDGGYRDFINSDRELDHASFYAGREQQRKDHLRIDHSEEWVKLRGEVFTAKAALDDFRETMTVNGKNAYRRFSRADKALYSAEVNKLQTALRTAKDNLKSFLRGDTTRGRHPHPEPVVGDIWFQVLTSPGMHLRKESEIHEDGRNFGGHSVLIRNENGVVRREIDPASGHCGIHSHHDEGKYHLAPNPTIQVQFPGKLHSEMGEAERKRHVNRYHDGVDPGDHVAHLHSRTVQLTGDEAREESQAARICTQPLTASNFEELVMEWGCCFILIEGHLKSTALAALGVPVLTIASVTTWDCHELQAICEHLLSKGIQIFIVPDADWALNELVVNATNLFKATLQDHGVADIRVTSCPINWDLYADYRLDVQQNREEAIKPEKVDLKGKGFDDGREEGMTLGDLDTLSVVEPDRQLIVDQILANRHVLVDHTIDAKTGKPRRPKGLTQPGVERLADLMMNLTSWAGYTEHSFRGTFSVIANVMVRSDGSKRGKNYRQDVPQDLRDLRDLGLITVSGGSLDDPELRVDYFDKRKSGFRNIPTIVIAEPFRATLQTSQKLLDQLVDGPMRDRLQNAHLATDAQLLLEVGEIDDVLVERIQESLGEGCHE